MKPVSEEEREVFKQIRLIHHIDGTELSVNNVKLYVRLETVDIAPAEGFEYWGLANQIWDIPIYNFYNLNTFLRFVRMYED